MNEEKKPYKKVEIKLVDGSVIIADMGDWQEEILTNEKGYTNHFHIIVKRIKKQVITNGQMYDEVTSIIPHHAVVLVKFW